MSGIQTWILIMIIRGMPLVISNYGSGAECERVRQYVEEKLIAEKAWCIPGPVEVR